MSLMNGPFWALRLSWITLAGLGRTRNPSRAKSHNPPDRPCGLDSASCATLLLRNGQTRSQQQIRGEAALPGRESRLPRRCRPGAQPRRASQRRGALEARRGARREELGAAGGPRYGRVVARRVLRSEEHTSELQSQFHLV